MILPPFLYNTYIEQTDIISNYLLLELKPEIISFDNAHKYERDFQLATDSYKEFRGYLWVASNGKLSALSIIPDANDIELNN